MGKIRLTAWIQPTKGFQACPRFEGQLGLRHVQPVLLLPGAQQGWGGTVVAALTPSKGGCQCCCCCWPQPCCFGTPAQLPWTHSYAVLELPTCTCAGAGTVGAKSQAHVPLPSPVRLLIICHVGSGSQHCHRPWPHALTASQSQSWPQS